MFYCTRLAMGMPSSLSIYAVADSNNTWVPVHVRSRSAARVEILEK